MWVDPDLVYKAATRAIRSGGIGGGRIGGVNEGWVGGGNQGIGGDMWGVDGIGDGYESKASNGMRLGREVNEAGKLRRGSRSLNGSSELSGSDVSSTIPVVIIVVDTGLSS